MDDPLARDLAGVGNSLSLLDFLLPLIGRELVEEAKVLAEALDLDEDRITLGSLKVDVDCFCSVDSDISSSSAGFRGLSGLLDEKSDDSLRLFGVSGLGSVPSEQLSYALAELAGVLPLELS